MANALFTAYKQETLGDAAGPGHGTVDWEQDTINCVLVDHGTDTPAPTTDADIADIGAGARVVTPAGLASKTVVLSTGTATVDAADITFSAVSGNSAESIVLYKVGGSEATSLLIAFFDTASGLPVTPNGGDITITWNASGIFTW